MTVGAWTLVAAVGVSYIAASSLCAQAARSSIPAPVSRGGAVPYGCPTSTSIVGAVSPGDVSITVPDGNERAVATNGHTIFYVGNVRAPVVDTGDRHRDSAARTRAGTGAVKSRATGEVISASAASGKRAGTKHAAARHRRLWTVQVAAYETFDEAQTMQAELCQRGYQARILGAVRPYDVRVGRYPTSDSAMAIARRLGGHLTVFVTPAE